MSKAAVKNRMLLGKVLIEMFQQWRTNPNRRRNWHVYCTFGGASFWLPKTRESEIHKNLAASYRVVYIDTVNGFIFVDDEKHPASKVKSI